MVDMIMNDKYEIEKDKGVLCVIPARGGSKRIKDKNTRMLCDKPLVSYTIESALYSKLFKKIIITTDSEKVKSVCKDYRVDIEDRDKKLCTDESKALDVCIDVLERNRGYKYVAMLLPTSPTRIFGDIIMAFDKLVKSYADNLIGVNKYIQSPLRALEIDGDGYLRRAFDPTFCWSNTQDLPTHYVDNGFMYIWRSDVLLKQKQYYNQKTIPFYIGNVPDIDSIEDFEYTEYLLRRRLKNDRDVWKVSPIC